MLEPKHPWCKESSSISVRRLLRLPLELEAEAVSGAEEGAISGASAGAISGAEEEAVSGIEEEAVRNDSWELGLTPER